MQEMVNHLAFGWKTLALVRELIGTLREERLPVDILLLFPLRNGNAAEGLQKMHGCLENAERDRGTEERKRRGKRK